MARLKKVSSASYFVVSPSLSFFKIGIMLSKLKYIRGTNWPKSLWLYAQKKDQQIIGEATRAFFERGISVGELAQQYFPFGEGNGNKENGN